MGRWAQRRRAGSHRLPSTAGVMTLISEHTFAIGSPNYEVWNWRLTASRFATWDGGNLKWLRLRVHKVGAPIGDVSAFAINTVAGPPDTRWYSDPVSVAGLPAGDSDVLFTFPSNVVGVGLGNLWYGLARVNASGADYVSGVSYTEGAYFPKGIYVSVNTTSFFQNDFVRALWYQAYR